LNSLEKAIYSVSCIRRLNGYQY